MLYQEGTTSQTLRDNLVHLTEAIIATRPPAITKEEEVQAPGESQKSGRKR
jgi:hypothetical protein